MQHSTRNVVIIGCENMFFKARSGQQLFTQPLEKITTDSTLFPASLIKSTFRGTVVVLPPKTKPSPGELVVKVSAHLPFNSLFSSLPIKLPDL